MSLAALAGPVAAHPLAGAGGSFAAGFAHPLSGFDHLLAMIAVGIWAAQIGGRARWAVPLSFIGAMLTGCALGLLGLELPHVEPAISASVLVSGLLVFAYPESGVLAGALLVSSFAVFHGLAHAHAIPGSGSISSYIFGFTLATAMLHGVGIVVAAALRSGTRFAGISISLAGCWMLANAVI